MSQALHHKIETMRNLWGEVKHKVHRLQQEQEETKKLVEQFRQGKLIPFQSLSDVALYEHICLAPGVICYRIPTHAKDHLGFVTEFEAQAILRRHYHDCEEIVQILRGSLQDFESNKTVRESIVYDPLQAHELYSPEGCLCLVYFNRQK